VPEIHEFRGLKELEHNLGYLSEHLRKRGVLRMMSRAAVPMRDDAKVRAPILQTPDRRRTPGTILRSIRIWRQRKTPYAATFYVGIAALSRKAISAFKTATKKVAGDNPNDPFYWRFLEFGTAKMRARPFLRPAFETKKHESANVALEEGRKFIADIARRFKRTR
jgi:HK97 gp10 family phage protein